MSFFPHSVLILSFNATVTPRHNKILELAMFGLTGWLGVLQYVWVALS